MGNHQSKLLKIAAASVLGISICATSLVVPITNHTIEVYAKTTYIVVKGKLVNASTKKVIKGYAVYNNKLYYNGSLKMGYTVYSNKLYYNGSLKKGYALYSNKLYYDGGLKKGYAMYSNKLYCNGSLQSGYITYNSKLYRNGILFTGTYNSLYYKSGVKYTGTIGNTQYKNGVIVGNNSGTTGNKIIQSFSSHSGSTLTNITVTTSTDVYRVTLGSYEMHYDGKNTFSYALINVKAGTSFTVYAYDEKNKLLQSMKYTVN